MSVYAAALWLATRQEMRLRSVPANRFPALDALPVGGV